MALPLEPTMRFYTEGEDMTVYMVINGGLIVFEHVTSYIFSGDVAVIRNSNHESHYFKHHSWKRDISYVGTSLDIAQKIILCNGKEEQ